jgi:RHS repeat-associated protein
MLNYPGGFGQETRGYNSLMQLTSIASSKISMTYNYSATQNNGRIVSSADAVTGENVSYTYDSLNRLIAAASTGVQWSESYSYDGFGNMTGKTSTKGTPANPQVDSTTNRARIINDYGFDANGNWLGVPGPLVNLVNTWNVENQLVSNGLLDSSGNPFTNTYDPAGKRVLQYSVNASYGPWGTLYFYSITGQRLATYHLYYVTGTPTTLTTSMYFGGRLLAPVDRLGSVRGNANGSIAYFPWGEEEKQSTGYTTPDGTDKYATYFRDGTTNGAGEDYANARYYNNNFGRFWSVDPGGVKTADPKSPQSWNRYAYTNDDAVNFSDPTGLDDIFADGCDPDVGDDCTIMAIQETDPGGGAGPVNYTTADLQTDSNGNLILDQDGNPVVNADPQNVTVSGNSDSAMPNGDVPIYGLFGQGSQVLAAVGNQATHDLGCAGLGWAVGGSSIAASTQVIPKGFSQTGTSGTSVASTILRNGLKAPIRVPTPVGMPVPGAEPFVWWRYTNSIGGILGRWLPYAGVTAGAVALGACLSSQP